MPLSDTMSNLGAFITLNGKDMLPNYTTYTAVVSAECKTDDLEFAYA